MVRHIPITAIALAGVGHLIIALGHSSHAFPHVVFFFLIGTAQLLWALTFWRYFFPKLYWAGLAVSGGTFHIWILTQLVSVPFALTADVIYPWPVAIISSELVGFVTLMGLMGRAHLAAYTGRSVARLIGGGLVIALVFGTVVWGGSHLTEVIFPGQGTSDGHQVGHEQAHQVVTRPPATPMPAPTPDIQLLIAAAVEAALTARPIPTSVPGEDSDLQGMIAAAVEAALTAPPTSASSSGPALDIQDILVAPSGLVQDNAPSLTPNDNVEHAVITATPQPALTALPQLADAATQATTPLAGPVAIAPPQYFPTPVPVGALASAFSRLDGKAIALAIIGALALFAAIGMWRDWVDRSAI